MSNKRRENGGLWALAGFLYQIVGMLSITTQVSELLNFDNSKEDLQEAFLSLENVGTTIRAKHEYLEDAAFINENDETVLVQFKYSIVGKKLGSGELRKIIDKLDKNVELASARGETVTACILVTNRLFTSQRGAAKQLWDEEQAKKRRYSLRKSLITLDIWAETLEMFGRQLCVSDHDIQSGVNGLIGEILRKTGGQNPSVSITVEDIKEAFTDCREARQVTPKNAHDHSLKQLVSLQEWDTGLQIPIIPRDILQDISSACTRNALVILHGHGGCGKTAMLWLWLKEKEFASFSTTRNFSRNWLAHELCNWVNLPANHPWRTLLHRDEIIERVIKANADYPLPIIHLGLDGLDEGYFTGEARHNIRGIIQWFWNEDMAARRESRSPRAVLVLTCRDLNYLKREWLPSVPSGFNSTYDLIDIPINNFSSHDLHIALRSSTSLDKRVKSKITDNLEPFSFGDMYSTLTPTFRSLTPHVKLVDQSVIKALHHPIIWRVFLGLETPIQLGILDGNSKSLMKLAEIFVSRFCQKVLDRQRIEEIQEDDVYSALRQIANTGFSRSQATAWLSYRDWSNPLSETGFWNRIQSKRFFREALSGGLIIDNPDYKWQWYYPWIQEYLVSGSEK
ncbi:MAG: hypothetical protein AAF614_36895 [Chloroflexota bacterium]